MSVQAYFGAVPRGLALRIELGFSSEFVHENGSSAFVQNADHSDTS